MKKILLICVCLSSLVFAKNMGSNEKSEQQKRLDKQIQIEMAKEKKYSIEQTFYSEDNYDFKGSEVNVESLKHLPVIEVDDLDMDSVYD